MTIIVLIVGLSLATYGLVRFGYGPLPRDRSHPGARLSATAGHHHPVRYSFRLPAKFVGMAVNPPLGKELAVMKADLSGRRPAVVEIYLAFGNTIPVDQLQTLEKLHIMPLLQINPKKQDLHGVARGKYDAWLTKLAKDIKTNIRGPIGLSFAHEMNGYWYPWSVRDPVHHPLTVKTRPENFRAAWRHIWNLFAADHVPGVKWVWTISRDAQRAGWPPLRAWWPGAKYVTWIGLNGYYRYTDAQTFDSLYKQQLGIVRTFTSDPAVITETGVGPGPAQTREIENLFAGIKRTKGMLGFIWFDVNVDEQWNIDNNKQAIAAIKTGMSRYGFGG